MRAGPIDIHAHVLPENCLAIPTATGELQLREVNGELHLGNLSLSIRTVTMYDMDMILEDMDTYGLAVRAMSPPPFTFALDAPADRAAAFVASVNDGLVAMCEQAPDRLRGLGSLPLADLDAAVAELRRLAEIDWIRGVTVPPLVKGVSFEADPLGPILREAHRLGMCMIVHPMQLPGPGLGHHYLINLLGNPTESAAAIGGVILSGLADELDGLRLAFLHGAGCAPGVLGRWDHGWGARPDVSAHCARPPSEVFRDRIWADNLTHSADHLRFLASVTGAERLVLGSDYPFDMAAKDPVGAAEAAGLDVEQLTRNALRFLGY